jgi:FKBP-type peptidyl-prolyl cis-trans isomerase FkpA
MIRAILILFAIASLFSSCDKKAEEKQARIDRQKILDFIARNGLDAQETESGLFYVIEEPGEGEHPAGNSIITVHYKGYLLNGYIFDSTEDIGEPFIYRLSSMIKGWQEGIPLFKKDGKGKLLVPSHLGYGSMAFYDIPANSVLIFEIHLVDFE